MRLRLVATPAITALADHAKAVNQASWHRDGCTAPRHNRVFAAATGLAPGTAAATPNGVNLAGAPMAGSIDRLLTIRFRCNRVRLRDT